MDIDVFRILGAVERSQSQTEKEGVRAAAVTLTRTYDTDVEDLWEAITTPERIARWFLPVEGELKLGGRYQLKGNAGGVITACAPPRSGGEGRFEATWEFGGGKSWIDVSVQPEGRSARLTLQHIAPINAHWEKYGPGATGVGWELGLMGLDLHVAGATSEAAVDPKAFEAWSMSEDGKSFIRESGEGWGRADIGGGTEAGVARARANRTIAFYTGQPEPD